MNMKKCPQCGGVVARLSRRCAFCGHSFYQKPIAESAKSKHKQKSARA